MKRSLPILVFVSEETLRHKRVAGIKDSAEAVTLQRINATSCVLRNSEEEALKAVTNKEVKGYLCDEITPGWYCNNEYRGKIAVYPTNLRRFSFAFGLPKDSPWRTKINVALMNLRYALCEPRR